MDWCRLSTSYYLDGALLCAGEAAEVLFIRCIAYSGAKETRGRVPRHAIPMLTPVRPAARVTALLAAGLLTEDGPDLVIRSWTRWQEALDVEADRRRRDRERKAAVRGTFRQKSADSSAENDRTVRAVCSRKEVEVEVEKEQTPKLTPLDPPKRSTRIPDVFPTDEDHAQRLAKWADEHAPAVSRKHATEAWRDWHLAKGDTAKDWNASWRTWMRRAQTDTERTRNSPQTRPSTTDSRVTQSLQRAAELRAQENA